MNKMEITAAKIDNYKIRITKTEDPVVTEHEYDINFLLEQRKNIQKSKDDFCAARDQELKEIDHLIEHCAVLNIKIEDKINDLPEVITEPLIKKL
jgi:glycyl-tRNA synthetase beta subunit